MSEKHSKITRKENHLKTETFLKNKNVGDMRVRDMQEGLRAAFTDIKELKETSGVKSVSATVDDQVGTPDVSVDFSDGELSFAFSNLKGEQGIQGPQGSQGDSAVYDPSSPDAPDFVMANTTGQSTTKAMTQKAVTDAVKEVDLLENAESADFDIADDNGNVVARFDGGHIKTKYFDSSINAMTAKQSEKLARLNPDAEANEVVTSNEGDADLDIADEMGNIILQVNNGHIHTKNFHSDEIAVSGNIVKPKFMIGEIDSDGYYTASTTRMYSQLVRVAKGDVVRIVDTSLIGGMLVTEYNSPSIIHYNESGGAVGKKKVAGSDGYIMANYTISSGSARYANICVKLPDDGTITNSRNFYNNIVVVRKSDIDDKARYNVPAGYYVSHHSEFSTWTQDTDSNSGERLTLQQIQDACQELANNYPDYVTLETIGRDESDTYDIYKLVLQPHPAFTQAITNYIDYQKEPRIFMAAMVHGDEHPCCRALLNAITHICRAGDFTITKRTMVKEGDAIVSDNSVDYALSDQGYNTQLVGTTSTSEDGGQTTIITYTYKYESYINNPFLKYLRWGVTLVTIPVRNPWGLVNNQRFNYNGVDLNRNFDGNGAWERQSDVNTRGISPLSESENQACWQVLMENADVLAAYDLHAHGKWGNVNGIPTWYEKTAFSIGETRSESRDMLENVGIAINKGFTESGWANHRMPKNSGPVGVIQFDYASSAAYFSVGCGIDLGISSAMPEVMHKYYTGASESGSRYNEDIDCMNEEYLVNIFLETIRQNNK